jgi:hypothetical protein
MKAKPEPSRKDSHKVERKFSHWYNLKRVLLSTPESFLFP